jgi:hypothetical protein
MFKAFDNLCYYKVHSYENLKSETCCYIKHLGLYYLNFEGNWVKCFKQACNRTLSDWAIEELTLSKWLNQHSECSYDECFYFWHGMSFQRFSVWRHVVAGCKQLSQASTNKPHFPNYFILKESTTTKGNIAKSPERRRVLSAAGGHEATPWGDQECCRHRRRSR